jgi:hypothetical protein
MIIKILFSVIIFIAFSLSNNAIAQRNMPIGTNFWNISWGNGAADPFLTGYTNAINPDKINDFNYNPFKPSLLEEVQIYSFMRTMDFVQTNSSVEKVWNNRIRKSSVVQKPMSWDWVLEMSNFADRDAWICIPHQTIDRNGTLKGTNSYVKKLAILFKYGVDMKDINLDGIDLSSKTTQDLITLGGVQSCRPLNKNLRVYIEYSNETWTSSLGTQGPYCKAEGAALNLNQIQFHSWAAIHMFEDWEQVWGKDNPRTIKVDALQRANSSQIDSHLAIYNSTVYNINSTYPDGFAIAPYVSCPDGATESLYEELLSNLNGEKNLNNIRYYSKQIKSASKALARPFSLLAYEGGQGITTNADVASRNDEMYRFYLTMLDTISNYFSAYGHYVHAGAWSSGGAWGAKQRIGDPVSRSATPKMQAITDWIVSNVRFNLNVNGGSGSGYYAPGTIVIISSDTPPVGSHFSGWTGYPGIYGNVKEPVTTIVMPAQNAVISSSFDTGSSILDEYYKKNIIVYPNPFISAFRISCPDLIMKQISIWNSIGKKEAVFTTDGNEAYIDIANFPNGIYILEILTPALYSYKTQVIKASD